ncbi:DUF309 domain-containing protein [Peribacillus sp. SCS-37]|uniref:DUF309 domain-containing protein n=1 Tax=Paraperibacillus esterisolvens TaxID=3115296 RepID=UPI003906441C
MEYPEPFLDYLIEFHCTRDYFECHEILEEYWKEAPAGERSPVWQGFIQLAVGLYHFRRDNRNGAARSLRQASRILGSERDEVLALGVDFERLKAVLYEIEEHLLGGKEYKSIEIPLINNLLSRCRERAASAGLVWNIPSDGNNTDLIHRHKTRDRSAVIAERQRQLELRRRNIGHSGAH